MNNEFLVIEYAGKAFHALHNRNDYETRQIGKYILEKDPLRLIADQADIGTRTKLLKLREIYDRETKEHTEAILDLDQTIRLQTHEINSLKEQIKRLTGAVHWYKPNKSCTVRSIYQPLVTTLDPAFVTCENCKRHTT